MEYIWTHWTKPQPNISYFDIACLGLSTALAKTHGTAKLIYTDQRGAEHIGKYLIGVPCVKSLSDIQEEDPRKWALSKINTYSKINYPCVHIDYDVFLWKEQKRSSADFCCQSSEDLGNFSDIYKATFHDFQRDAGWIPEEISKYSSQEIYAGYNMGYLQINNWQFLNKYAKESLPIFDGMKTFHRHNNVFPEQYLFYCMTKSHGINVDILFDNEKSWDEQCTQSGYTHLMEEKKKNRSSLFKRIMAKLEQYNPACHAAISKEIDWSVFEVGKSLVNSATSIISGGGKTTNEDTYNNRVNICKACEHHDASGYGGTGKCSICKCSTVAKPKMQDSKCPIDKW